MTVMVQDRYELTVADLTGPVPFVCNRLAQLAATRQNAELKARGDYGVFQVVMLFDRPERKSETALRLKREAEAELRRKAAYGKKLKQFEKLKKELGLE